MSERVTQGMIDCWRVNYDLDKTPHDLHAFWGYEAPSGAVIALKAACDEIQSLRKDAERYRWLRDSSAHCVAQVCFDGNLDWRPVGSTLDVAVDIEMAAPQAVGAA